MILLKNENEIEKIRVSSKYAIEMLYYLKDFIKEGMKTIELETLCENRIRKIKKVKPAFKGYNGFPYCLCVSVNDEVVHGMPGEYVLKKGDIVSLDFGIYCDGFYGDVAITQGVGELPETTEKLVRTTEKSLYKAIDKAAEGNRLHDISNAVQTFVECSGFSIVRDFVGHGIGKNLHEYPQVPNFGVEGTGIRLKKGMVFAIEPMVNLGKKDVIIAENGWTAKTKDGSLSAHFEHTVAITANGPDILSRI